MPCDVIKGKREGGHQGCDDASGIQPEATCADDADGERTAEDRERDRGNTPQGCLLPAARDHVEQHPSGRRVLQDDGGRDISFLN